MRVEKGKVRFSDYKDQSWSHKAAHQNGYLEALDDISKLISVSDKEQT